jgi:hypothetical protein
MKYVFLFCGTAVDQAAFDALTSEELRERYPQVGRWFAEHRGGLGPGNQLQGALRDRSLISDAIGLIECAAGRARPGPYQLEAAIAACHAEPPSIDRTDWQQIVVLYNMLVTLAPLPGVRLNRAIAVAGRWPGGRPAQPRGAHRRPGQLSPVPRRTGRDAA